MYSAIVQAVKDFQLFSFFSSYFCVGWVFLIFFFCIVQAFRGSEVTI